MDKAKAITLLKIMAPMGGTIQYHMWAEKYKTYTYGIYNEKGENISHLIADALQHEFCVEEDLYIEPSIAGTLSHRVLAVRCNHGPIVIIAVLGRVVYGDVGAYNNAEKA